MKPGKSRVLMRLEAIRHVDGVSGRHRLCFEDVTVEQAESAMVVVMRAVNNYLDFVGSQYVVGVYDKETGERQSVSVKEGA